MDWKYQNNTGPVDATSPFAQVSQRSYMGRSAVGGGVSDGQAAHMNRISFRHGFAIAVCSQANQQPVCQSRRQSTRPAPSTAIAIKAGLPPSTELDLVQCTGRQVVPGGVALPQPFVYNTTKARRGALFRVRREPCGPERRLYDGRGGDT